MPQLGSKARDMMLTQRAKDLQTAIYGACCVGSMLAIICFMHINQLTFYNRLAEHACNRTLEYSDMADDICIFHNGSSINTTTQQLGNIMVVKQHTGEIQFNQTLACSINHLLPYFSTDRNYCSELMAFIAEGNQTTARGFIEWLLPRNAANTITRVIPCKIHPNATMPVYINTDHMNHLCQAAKVNVEGRIAGWTFAAICYIFLFIFIYTEISNSYPPINHKLPSDATCVITYEPIPAGGMYYKCDQCVAVYDYEAIRYNWLHYSKKCGYCSKPIKELFKYCNQ